jgi:transketolase
MIANQFAPSRLRRTILDMAFAGSTVHIACAFSIVEILAILYGRFLRYPGNDPEAELRDYLVLSKGHGVMAQYACMRELGWLGDADIQNYFGDGTQLKGLSDSRVRGLEVTSGSLGHGFSVGVGLALGARLRGTDQKVFAVVGDGEINEGPIWEGALFAAQQKLDNFITIVDANGFQAMGATRDVLELGDIGAKFTAFGFEAQTVNGHDTVALEAALTNFVGGRNGIPKVLVARTVKGKGVSFMESNNMWHYTRLTPEIYQKAIAEVGAV